MAAFDPLQTLGRYLRISGMRSICIFLVLLLVVACSSSEERRQAAFMDEIDGSVRLPVGASALKSYNRYYVYGKHGDVFGLYVLAHAGERPERQWLTDPTQLPIVLDGGCGVVGVKFDIKSKKTEARCNGDV